MLKHFFSLTLILPSSSAVPSQLGHLCTTWRQGWGCHQNRLPGGAARSPNNPEPQAAILWASDEHERSLRRRRKRVEGWKGGTIHWTRNNQGGGKELRIMKMQNQLFCRITHGLKQKNNRMHPTEWDVDKINDWTANINDEDNQNIRTTAVGDNIKTKNYFLAGQRVHLAPQSSTRVLLQREKSLAGHLPPTPKVRKLPSSP